MNTPTTMEDYVYCFIAVLPFEHTIFYTIALALQHSTHCDVKFPPRQVNAGKS